MNPERIPYFSPGFPNPGYAATSSGSNPGRVANRWRLFLFPLWHAIFLTSTLVKL